MWWSDYFDFICVGYVIIQILSSVMTQLRMCSKSNTIGATSEARKTDNSGATSH